VPDANRTPKYALKHLCIIGDPHECIRQRKYCGMRPEGLAPC
jgi:hypothetical protein